MNFFEVLINPEREESEAGERTLVVQAANLLQVGEFQLLQLAYHEWFGRDLPEALVSRLFTNYMLHNEVPHWARHYARLIISREDRGLLKDSDPAYHRYDSDYTAAMPQGVRKFVIAAGIIAFTMVASFLAASLVAVQPTSLLPPYFDNRELTPAEEDATLSPSLPPPAPLDGGRSRVR